GAVRKSDGRRFSLNQPPTPATTQSAPPVPEAKPSPSPSPVAAEILEKEASDLAQRLLRGQPELTRQCMKMTRDDAYALAYRLADFVELNLMESQRGRSAMQNLKLS